MSVSSISADGRYVAFQSLANNLVLGDTNDVSDVFVYDRLNATTTRVSIDSTGAEGNDFSAAPSISSDGRYVAFASGASNLVPGDTNGGNDVFVHDSETGATTRVSVASGGAQARNGGYYPSISGDGRYVAFQSGAIDLVPGDTNGLDDIFVHDRQTVTTIRVSVDSSGAEANDSSWFPSISGDGRYVTFYSSATNLVTRNTQGFTHIFVHDCQSGATTLVSVDSNDVPGNGNGGPSWISSDGRYVAFASFASNLVPGDTNLTKDIFVHDLQTGATTRVSVNSSGGQSSYYSDSPAISSDGRYVTFRAYGDDLVPGDTDIVTDIFVHDRQTGATTRVSGGSCAAQANNHSRLSSLSADGRYVVFESLATNLVPWDTNGVSDIFVYDRAGAPAFPISCCGDGSGALCGCGNAALPRSGSGCLNGLGVGAALTATGSASVTNDTLELSCQGVPTQPGLFFQGDTWIGGGTGSTFGDGIRCCGQNVVRLEVVVPPPPQPATASTTVVISQHAPPGTVNAGDTKCYQHWYRNPGSSPCGTNFNLSNAVQATWGP